MASILLVEDDINLGTLLKENLENKGFDATWCKNADEFYDVFKKKIFNLCIFDVMLPIKDGFSLARELRIIDNGIPIIFLTAKSLPEDKIKGFEAGGDDYITKPFNTYELYLRINAILKRIQGSNIQDGKMVSIGNFQFDYKKMILQNGIESKKLSAKEAELINILFQNKNEIVSRTIILQKVWGNDDYFSAKSMDVYISKIRKMLKIDPNIEILNAYGIGYKMILNN